ncbi:hypothetical protein EYC80_004288 [Monilinia laxa]|uniref:Uncharacterized protein n=1 Tax=Monilinia laxa TaxID=61186 RepID=A0A5N6KMD7_MONLA|nr:hypothetical protein EYC80_004288 [Monilinia laxa]
MYDAAFEELKCIVLPTLSGPWIKEYAIETHMFVAELGVPKYLLYVSLPNLGIGVYHWQEPGPSLEDVSEFTGRSELRDVFKSLARGCISIGFFGAFKQGITVEFVFFEISMAWMEHGIWFSMEHTWCI